VWAWEDVAAESADGRSADSPPPPQPSSIAIFG
jgi:hypothetical protein